MKLRAFEKENLRLQQSSAFEFDTPHRQNKRVAWRSTVSGNSAAGRMTGMQCVTECRHVDQQSLVSDRAAISTGLGNHAASHCQNRDRQHRIRDP